MPYCKISSSNFKYNLNRLIECVDKSKIAIVLKSNAYGHGIREIGKLAHQNNIQHAIVYTYEEAIMINDFFKSILILQSKSYQLLPENFHLTINCIEDLKYVHPKTKIELNINIGMNRNGISSFELDKALSIIIERKLRLEGIFGHFSSSDANDDTLFVQKKAFDCLMEKKIPDTLRAKIRTHVSNSSALFRFTNKEYDLVRIGIGLYGYLEMDSYFETPTLKPIMSLWANRISSRVIRKGDSVGYGLTYTANKDELISTYDLGYAHGFFRQNEFSNYILPNGNPIIGRTSMECFTTYGDAHEVCIFDNAKWLAKKHNTIIYEVLSSIKPSINKVIV
jgi:alanine racemase